MLLGKAGCVVVVEQGDYAAPCARALCQSPERWFDFILSVSLHNPVYVSGVSNSLKP
jgi:hypothetical protein